MSTQGLTAPGSAQYNSPLMAVGDGTWDSQDNTFLLPNLQGLNLAMTQYNGMGNRFAELPGYVNLIKAHGILAAIVFLFIVPFAIMFNRFYGRNPWTALRVHIWCQIMTMLLVTVLFILGFMAVGPSRSLTNPHHAIGVAIYSLIWWQFILGWWVHRREKRRRLPYPTVTAVIHKWTGRATALLGLAQIPLGLALFGSPEYLFILYAVVVFGLLVIYFIFSYIQERNHGYDYDDQVSHHSYHQNAPAPRRSSNRFSNLAKGAAAGVGISALANRLRHRRDVASSRHSGTSTISSEEEKYSQYGHRPTEGLGRRNIMGLGVLATISYWFGKIFARRKNRRDADDGSTEYSDSTEESIEHLEEGRPPAPIGPGPTVAASPGPSPRPHHPLNPSAMASSAVSHHRTASSMSTQSWEDGSPSKARRGHGLRDAAIGIGTFAFAREFFKRRKDKKEQRRIDELRDQELEDERIQRANSRKYTGDGVLRPPRPPGSVASTNLSAPPGGPSAAGALASDGIAATAAHNQEMANAPSSHLHVPGTNVHDPFVNDPLAPPPPPHSVHGSSGSDVYASSGGREHRRHHNNIGETAATAAAGGAVGLAAGEALARERERQRRERSESQRRSAGADSMGSQPVSVKLNMHSDGRHVTLRRLTEEEAAAERARQARTRQRRRRAESASTLSSPDNGDRWRRTEAIERREQASINNQSQATIPGISAPNGAGVGIPPNMPPPPPIPDDPRLMKPGPGSIGSPGTYDGNLTETSTNYENNRRRRRAERAAATREKRLRAERGEFT